jgi:hypothetical protein
MTRLALLRRRPATSHYTTQDLGLRRTQAVVATCLGVVLLTESVLVGLRSKKYAATEAAT